MSDLSFCAPFPPEPITALVMTKCTRQPRVIGFLIELSRSEGRSEPAYWFRRSTLYTETIILPFHIPSHLISSHGRTDGFVTVTTILVNRYRYNGPGAQQVSVRFNRDWNSILPANHKYIVVIVDGRGTGYKGRKFRNTVRDNLGFFETRDQIYAAR